MKNTFIIIRNALKTYKERKKEQNIGSNKIQT